MNSPVPIVRGTTAALAAPSLFWFAGAYHHTLPIALWLIGVGIAVGGVVYCRERARSHLMEEATEPSLRRFFIDHISWSAEDYDPAGKRWIWAWRGCAVATVALWIIGNVFIA
jgi:hypothetical protein